MNRSLLVLLVVSIAAAALFIAGGAARSQAAVADGDCAFDGSMLVCTIIDGDGISDVQVTELTAQGIKTAVNESFTGCPTQVEVKWTPLVPNFNLIVDDCGSDTGQSVFLNSLGHSPLGEATIALGQNGLTVLNFDREEDDGVQVDLNGASEWSALLLPEAPASRGMFAAAAFVQGQRDPLSSIQFTNYMTDVIVYPSGKNVDVLLFNGDKLVHETADVPGGSRHVSLVEPFCAGAPALLTCTPRLTFGQDLGERSLFWEIDLPAYITFTVPTGEVAADRVLFIERNSPNFPATLTGVELIGTELPRLTIFDAISRPPLPANTSFLPAVREGNSPADPFGFDELTRFMESDPPVGQELRLSDDLSVRVVGVGQLIDEEVVEPEPGDIADDGLPDPKEPEPASTSQALRVFNTSLQKEFEIQVSGDLFDRLSALLPGTGAQPPAGAALGSDNLLLRGLRTRGLSDGSDNRVHLTSTTWWPWRTIVHFSNNCSGALVGPRHILTAAHCINKRGTNQWYSFTVSPGRNGSEKPFGDAAMNPNPQPGDPFRWYFTPSGWRDEQYNDENCEGSCFAASQWDWGLIIIPEYLGYQTGWMGFVARPASQLNPQAHFNRGYPACNTGKPNVPAGCDTGELFGDSQICSLGNYSYQGGDGWNRLIRNSCDISGGHSGSPVYHYFYDPYLGQSVPVAAMVEVWEHCYTCSASDGTPNTARRLTPSSINTIVFFRQWKP